MKIQFIVELEMPEEFMPKHNPFGFAIFEARQAIEKLDCAGLPEQRLNNTTEDGVSYSVSMITSAPSAAHPAA